MAKFDDRIRQVEDYQIPGVSASVVDGKLRISSPEGEMTFSGKPGEGRIQTYIDRLERHHVKTHPRTVAAGTLHGGDNFRKKTGEMVYLVISDSSARFYKLGEGKVYGVCDNGNMASVDPETQVVKVALVGEEGTWEDVVEDPPCDSCETTTENRTRYGSDWLCWECAR